MKHLIPFIFICLLLSSCNRELQDQFVLEITNNTDFEINSLLIESKSRHVFNLEPGESTGEFNLILKRYDQPDRIEKRTCVSVEIDSFTDSTGNSRQVAQGCVPCFTQLDLAETGTTKFQLTSKDMPANRCGELMFSLVK